MKRLRFIQIPKTAGSTLSYFLVQQYRGKRYFFFHGEFDPDMQRYQSLSEKEKQEIELFIGHAPISTGIPDADQAVLITLLRNPINRIKSFCQHASEGKSPYLLEDFPPESFNLDYFLDHCRSQELTNLQTKMLINSGSCHSSELISSMSPAAARDLALANLQTVVSCFGIQEYFDESMILFSQFLGWQMPFYLSANRGDPRRLLEFKQRHLDHIAELNAIDMEVYNAAKERFLSRIAQADYARTKLKLFQMMKPLASPALKIRKRIEKMQRRSQ